MLAFLLAAAAGGAVATAIGVYANVHVPTGEAISTFGFPAVLPMKVWLATGAFALAFAQLGSALWMWERLPAAGRPPEWIGAAHRWSGTAAFLLSLPVAYHCLWSLGFRTTDLRVVVHGLLGCAFYGAITTKLLALRSERMPGWALPLAGGALVVLLTGLWVTSSLWYFSEVGFPGL